MIAANDFYYDGQYLSDYGFIICGEAGEVGDGVVTPGSKITFNKVARNGGKRFSLTSAKYDECYTAEFHICKKNNAVISNDEYRDIMRWLNRREFLQLYFIDDFDNDSDTCFYNASFAIEKVYNKYQLRMLKLTMETDSPFGYGQEQTATYTIGDITKTVLLSDVSDEIGYTYPSMEITINKNGDFEMYNQTFDSLMRIKNCSVDEVITIDGDAKIISTSNEAHKATLYNDFNFEFFKFGNTIDNRSNRISFTLPCKVELRYKPIIK